MRKVRARPNLAHRVVHRYALPRRRASNARERQNPHRCGGHFAAETCES